MKRSTLLENNMNNEIQKLEEAISRLEEERDDNEGMFQSVRLSGGDTLGREKYLFLKYGELHREKLFDLKLEITEKKIEFEKLKK
jgi:hypothetical protein